MKIHALKFVAAALVLVAGLWSGAAPARAQMTIYDLSHVTSVNGVLTFDGTVEGISPDVVTVSADGQLLHIPMRLAHFLVNSVDMDPTQLYVGLPVEVRVADVHGTVTAMSNGRVCIDTTGGRLELPMGCLDSTALRNTTVAFRNPSGNVVIMPLRTALDAQAAGRGVVAIVTAPPIATTTTIGGTTTTTVGPTTVVTNAPPPGPRNYVIPAISLSGTVMQINSDIIGLNVNGAEVLLPTRTGITYYSNGNALAASDLGLGLPVTVTLPSVVGQIQTLNNGMITLQDADGATITLPVTLLPADFTANSMVFVRDRLGRVHQVPLATAITMVNEGATLLSPGEVLAVPPDDIRP